MITASAVYHVLETMAPLYTAAFLGYTSVRWLGAFSEEQCAGINHFVAIYALPMLIFDMVSTSDPYAMDARLVAADTLQKAATLLGLLAWAAWSSSSSRRGETAESPPTSSPLRWVVTAFSVAQLPSTIIMGVPLLGGMYGPVSKDLLKQIVVLQFCVWYNVVIFLYEYMEARRVSSPATDGGTNMIIPASPEKGDTVAAERADHVTMDVKTTELAAAEGGMDTGQTTTVSAGEDAKDAEAKDASLPTAPPSARHIVFMAVKKVLSIPNTYASFLGLIWALIAFRCGIKMPKIIMDSMFIVQTTTIGLSMFASGTFIARQSRFVPCGYAVAAVSMVLKFLIGPVLMLLASLAVGMRGTLLRVAVVQAALPLAVASFVYAEEYKVHADIMSTGIPIGLTVPGFALSRVILGIFISFPVTVVYYILLGL